MYQSVEKDALFAQLIDSDFAGGFSDNDGLWCVPATLQSRTGCSMRPTSSTSATSSVANGAGQTEVDYQRLQLDFNVKF